MNFYSIFSFLFIIGVTLAGVVTTITPKEYHMFADLPAIFLVIGGTVGAAAVTVQIDRVGVLLKAFFIRLIQGKRKGYSLIIKEVITISESYRRGEPLSEVIKVAVDPFFKEGLQMMEDNIIKGDDLFDMLEDRLSNMHKHYSEEANRFKNLGKYPPAFGLMGTVLGMVALLANLGGTDAMKLIGPAMGTCLVATFLGIVVANVFILPIGDSLSENAKEIYLKNKIILEGLRLISEKTNPVIVAEKLNSFLLPGDRLDWKEMLGQKAEKKDK